MQIIDCLQAIGSLAVSGNTVTTSGESEPVSLTVVSLSIVRLPPNGDLMVTAQTSDGETVELI